MGCQIGCIGIKIKKLEKTDTYGNIIRLEKEEKKRC